MYTSFLSRLTAVAFATLIMLGTFASVNAQVTFYENHATWLAQVNAGTLISEDYEDLSQISNGQVLGCTASPINNTTSDVCALPGEIELGLQLSDVPGPDPAGGLVACGSGCVGTAVPSKVLCHNTFVDMLRVDLTNGDTRAFGGQLGALFGNTAPGTIQLFDAGDTLLGTHVTSFIVDDAFSNFFGFTSATTPVAYLIYDATAAHAACIDDIEFTNTLIPVELVSFTGVANGLDVSLNWETSSETNNAGFEVQVQDGENWTALGFVDGNGTTTEAQVYNFAINDMAVGTYSFRLKQVDYDGAFTYHGDVEVAVETPGTHLISSAYPNPFNPQSQFTLAVAQEQNVTAELFNTIGQRVAVLFSGTVEANQTQLVTIDGAGLASGMYVVRVNGESFSDALSVTLLK